MTTQFDAFVASLVGRRPRLFAAATLVALAVYLLYHLTQFRPASFADPTAMVDFTIQYFMSKSIVATGHYPDLAAHQFFPYPPPMAILFSLFGVVDLASARALWAVVKAVALVWVLVGGLRLIEAEARAERWLIVIGAVVCADPVVHWDLRTYNNLLVYLALIVGALLAERRAWRAGALLALSATLKLYSGLFLPWLLWRGCHRWLLASLAVLVLLWVVLPLALFGFAESVTLYREWWGQVAYAGTPAFYAAPAPLVTLRHGLAGLFGIEPFGPAMAPLLLATRLAWVGLLGLYVLVGRKPRTAGRPVTPSDAVVLMLAPLPFSPILQPPHGAVMLLGAMILVGAALDPRHSPRLRLTVAIAAATGFFLGKLAPDWSLRGAVLFASFVAQVIGLTLLRMAADRAPASDAPTDW